MEKFTNNRDDYLNQIKTELLKYDLTENWKEIFIYAEIPFFLRYAFSYNWSVNSNSSKYRLKRKEWNAEYDHSRFNKGIYNLDRLAIVETEIQVNPEDQRFLASIEWNKVGTTKFEGIVLDGLVCELKIKKQKKSLNWNIDDEMNKELADLVKLIRNWKRELKEL